MKPGRPISGVHDSYGGTDPHGRLRVPLFRGLELTARMLQENAWSRDQLSLRFLTRPIFLSVPAPGDVLRDVLRERIKKQCVQARK